MSESISSSPDAASLLAAARAGTASPADLQEFGNRNPSVFFRKLIEPLADSFDPADVRVYEGIMNVWLPPSAHVDPRIPDRVDTVYVLSRVTLGADVKITSIALDAMKQRFPAAKIVLVGGRKAAGLFSADAGISLLPAEYPRGGPIQERLAFGTTLRQMLATPGSIVVDPDSRMTQLGLVPPCEGTRYFHFASRTAGGSGLANLTALTKDWLSTHFGVEGSACVAPEQVSIHEKGPFAAASFGVGGNLTKRVPGSFEADVIRTLADRYPTIWVDRGAGGEEAERATAAVQASGSSGRVRFWEGSFAGFASITARSQLYVGYDSAGQHAAAALGVPLITIFAGAASARFRARWSPSGPGPITVIDADELSAEACLRQVRQSLPA